MLIMVNKRVEGDWESIAPNVWVEHTDIFTTDDKEKIVGWCRKNGGDDVVVEFKD